jgi:hypothetical protein
MELHEISLKLGLEQIMFILQKKQPKKLKIIYIKSRLFMVDLTIKLVAGTKKEKLKLKLKNPKAN